MKVGIVRNPVSGGGKMQSRWHAIESAIHNQFPSCDIVLTGAPGHASVLAHDFAKDGYDLVIAVGGDGSIGEVADGLLRFEGERPALSIISSGTGADFARNFELPCEADRLVSAIANATPRAIDAGKVTYIREDGTTGTRHFVNIGSLGVSGPTSRAVNAVKHRGKASGKLMFQYHTIRELLRYKFQDVMISLDGAEPFEARIAVVVVANAPWFGGGMKIAPQADMTDGQFDVLVFRAASKLKLLLDMNQVYSGTHLQNPLVSLHRARSVEVRPSGNLPVNAALVDVDGESPGCIPARYEILPGALKLRLPL
jgi:YegS/Rv2252/BmrU family lipid kinase